MSVDVSISAAQRYKASCTNLSKTWQRLAAHPVQQSTNDVSGQFQHSGSAKNQQSGTSPVNSQLRPHVSADKSHNVSVTNPTSANAAAQLVRTPLQGRIYWCVNSCWQEMRNTRKVEMNIDTMDDQAFFKNLNSEYDRLRGWRGKLFSLRCCKGVEFIQVSKSIVRCTLHDLQSPMDAQFSHEHPMPHQVYRMREQLPPRDQQCTTCDPLCAHTYHYEKKPSHDDEIHRKVAGEYVLQGMADPSQTNASIRTLRMVPKHKIRHTPSWDLYDEAWGIHAVQGWSLCRMVVWLVLLNLAELLFVILWLTLVDSTDIQTAFTVPGYMTATVALGLIIPQFIGLVD